MASAAVAIVVIAIVATIVAGSIRVESDPLAPRPKFRPVNQILGFVLLAALGTAPILWKLSNHGIQQPSGWIGAAFFVLAGILCLGGSLKPGHNAVFWYLASIAEILPWRGPSGRSGLLLLGILFGALGAYLVVAASGILG